MQLKSLSTYSIIMYIHKNHKPDSMVRERDLIHLLIRTLQNLVSLTTFYKLYEPPLQHVQLFII
jgi:hypothetical protein